MRKNRTILVAENDANVRKLISRVLRAEGFQVVAVASGYELWQTWTQLPSEIVLSDITMPGIMDGIDACLNIRRVDPGARLFMMSGNAEASRRAELEGLRVVLRKPFDIRDLQKWAAGI